MSSAGVPTREKVMLAQNRCGRAPVSSPPLLMISFASAHMCHEMMAGKDFVRLGHCAVMLLSADRVVLSGWFVN